MQALRAIIRKPARNFVNAISQDVDRQKPDYDKTMLEYADYANTLKMMGVELLVVEADERFPDGNFVEDTHLILDNKMIIELNPGTASRAGEPMSLSSFLPTDIPRVVLHKQFTIDGGDILQDGKIIYVGISKRTQQAAIDALAIIIEPLGYQVKAIQIPQGLHLKSGMTCMLTNHFIIEQSFENILKDLQSENTSINYFVVPSGEDFAANVLPFNGKIMIPKGCPVTKKYIEKYYNANDIYEVDTQQVRLVDGALTCSCLLLK